MWEIAIAAASNHVYQTTGLCDFFAFQFKAYAEQQYPSDPDRQAVLVRQLQEQHYRQYMQQVYQQQMESQVVKKVVIFANFLLLPTSTTALFFNRLAATNVTGISETLSLAENSSNFVKNSLR